jgi:hypothetical protein
LRREWMFSGDDAITRDDQGAGLGPVLGRGSEGEEQQRADRPEQATPGLVFFALVPGGTEPVWPITPPSTAAETAAATWNGDRGNQG